jgi:glycosyltransferase involved in cell wall biosynthesis
VDRSDATRPLRLLVINWQDRRNPQAGGAEVHLHEIFGRLAARGHDVQLLVSGWEGAPKLETVDGMRVHRTGGRHTFPLRVRSGFRSLEEGAPIDMVVEDINKLPLFTPLWARKPVVGLVPHLFGTTAFREASWPVAATVWSAERGIPWAYRRVPFQAISESTADDLEARGLDRSRISVIYPGIDHERFRPGPADSRFEEPTVVYVGRLKRYKGLEVVLQGLAGLTAYSLEPRLLVVGRGDDRPRLERAARSMGVAERVQFLGYVPEERKVELLQRAWVNVYPSPKEGWGLTNVEAAACGTPSIASNSPGLRESVNDGVSGYLVAHTDPEAWVERLRDILADDDRRRDMAVGAVEHAAGFSWDRAATKTEQSLVQIIRDGGDCG